MQKIDNLGNPKFQNLKTASLHSFCTNTAALFLEVDSCGCRENPQKIPAQAKIPEPIKQRQSEQRQSKQTERVN
jgi:hypothetical protein